MVVQVVMALSKSASPAMRGIKACAAVRLGVGAWTGGPLESVKRSVYPITLTCTSQARSRTSSALPTTPGKPRGRGRCILERRRGA